MDTNPRAFVALPALAAAILIAGPLWGAQSLECKASGEGTLCCWNGSVVDGGVLSNNALASRAPSDAKAVFIVHDRACSVARDGTLRCWGDNESGQLGDGTTAHRDAPVPVLNVDDVADVALGRSLSCALRRSGTVLCWGYDEALHARRPRPSEVSSLDHVVELAVGGQHACARRQDGTVWCWGYNRYGQLGDGTQESRARPVRVVGLSDAVELSAGLYHSCARRHDGSVWCWGNGWGGEDGTARKLLLPSPVTAIHDATALVSSGLGFVVTQKDGTVVSCTYDVAQKGSEATPRLVCRNESTLPPGTLNETQIVLRPSQVGLGLGERAAPDVHR